MAALCRTSFRLLDDGLHLVSMHQSIRLYNMQICRRGLIMTYGVFFKFYDEEFLLSRSDLQISLIGGTQSFLVLLLSLVVGRLLDARMHRWILAFGAVTLVMALVCLSFAGQNFALVWLTSGFTGGLGMTCFFMYSSHNAIEVHSQRLSCDLAP